MVKVIKKLCPPERYGIKCPYTRRPSRVVVHNTGNDAPAENEVSYMINRGDEISFHYAVDDQKAVQGLPENRNAWASGDGTGKGNMEGIHIEICYSLSGGPRFAKAEDNAAQLTADILRRYGWGLAQVTKHQDYDGKYCPHRTLDLGWERFKKMVEKYLKEDDDMTAAEVKEIIRKENPTYNTLDEVPSYWRADIKELVDKGIIAGSGGGKLGLTKSDCKAAVLAKRIKEKL
ncbi:N-acetylmuramoyl-L-alanine amidase family protein [Acutalibacter muris]|uniref:peptidoglycan recognition protein family protein n=1 Tax=Acutalibacter muris TaxID=1796620 RepID=UPI0020CDF560|nr:N-acetylmuramoyl-L-alanine amidase [Acutalibacter muris]